MPCLSKSNDFNVVRNFENVAQNFPEFTAIIDKNQKISYKALNEKSNQIAQYLKTKNVVANDFVAILLEPSIDFIVCMLATIKIGAAYLPLDILAPTQRIHEMIEDAHPKITITDKTFKSIMDEIYSAYDIKDIKNESSSFSTSALLLDLQPSFPIYMMYTSGSTGKPKGVIIPHQAVVNLCYTDNYAQIKAQEIVAQFSNLAFDACTFEIWSALLNGATLNIVPSQIRTNPDQLSAFYTQNKIDYLFLPTAYFHQIIKSAPMTLDNVSNIIFGGEQVNPTLLKGFIQYRKKSNKAITLINGYGPTEATTFTCRNIMTEQTDTEDDSLMSIGKPFQNVKTYILDEHMLPANEGELYISGINLALGYHNSEAQNKEKFIENPFSNEAIYSRLYKTGDKVRLLSNGAILCLGRFDDQVKVGGFRVHLNEIENKLMTYPNIALAAVIVELGGGQHKMLTAYVVLSDKSQVIHADDIRSFLADSLPAYMLPSKYVMVEKMPLTLVGKVDKKKLDNIPHTDLSFHIDVSTTHSIEKKIQEVWCHLLNRTSVDIHKNFFDLGANSLLITESCTLIKEELKAELKIADVLSHPTIYKLSRYLEGDIDVQPNKKHKVITSTDIAIIGMSCRFPKANSLQEFWGNLCNKMDCLERFELPDAALEKKNYVPVRGVLSDIEYFDAAFFGFNPVDASITDPQHRIFLEVAWEALEHAGVAPEKSLEQTISVFAGMTDSTYLQENLLKNNWFLNEYDHFQQRIANSIGMLSTQLSYKLNLKGRSVNVNTACSTGLIAVDQACQDLIVGDSDIALAGAVSIVVPQQKGYQYQEGSIVSPNGVCAPFSDKANGTVFSNGVGVVILKRLEDAIADNDTIYAVIKGRGVNNDGSDKLGYTAPSRSGQIACILSALEHAKLDADKIDYIEAHGTATHLGDIVEFDALKDAFKTQTHKQQFCALGTVKSNLGHTDVAAGMAGLIKTILCLHHQYIPPMPHYENPNPELNIDKSPFFINKESIVWDNQAPIHHAGVSAFGVGGTNIHMILSEYRTTKKSSHQTSLASEQLFILSAKSPQALEDMTDNFIAHISKTEYNTPDFLQHAAFTLQTGREDFPYRRHAVGQHSEEIKLSFSKNPIQLCNQKTQTNIIFMFPGQGTQYPQMAQEFMQIPYFAHIVETGAKLASKYLNCDFLALLQEDNPKELNETQYAQPALFIIEYALAKLLIHYGIQPNALIGHSLGEYVAACLADVFSFEDGVALVCERGMLMSRAPKGAMLAIECTIEDLVAYQSVIDDIDIALHNSSNHCVASGTQEAIHRLEKYLSSLSVSHQTLKVSHAFHSRLMENTKTPFIEMLSNIKLNAPNIPIVSNLTGDWLSAKDATDAVYWYKHLRHTVKLHDGLTLLSQDLNSFFIEVGPGRSLSVFLKNIARNNSTHQHDITHSLSEKKYNFSDLKQLYTILGHAWQHGLLLNWSMLHNNHLPQKIALPSYPFQQQHYWIKPDNQETFKKVPKLYKEAWSIQPVINSRLLSLENNTIKEHTWIILKSNDNLADIIIDFLNENGANYIIVEKGISYLEKESNHFVIDVSNKEHYEFLFRRTQPFIYKPIILHLFSIDNKTNAATQQELADGLHLGVYSLIYLVQAYIKYIGSHVLTKYAIITTGTKKVLGNEKIIPENATILGASRVIPLEYPSYKLKCFDLDGAQKSYDKDFFVGFFNELTNSAWEDHSSIVSYRHGFKYESNYIAIHKDQLFRRFIDNGVYFVTGGLGGLGLSLCEAIASNCHNPIFILVSRTLPLPPEKWVYASDVSHGIEYTDKIKVLINLQNRGASIYWEQGDVACEKSMSNIVNKYIKTLGRINAIIHAAGIPGEGVLQLKSKAAIDKVFNPKILGAFVLSKVFKTIQLDFVVLMSSIAAVTGEPGQIDYSSANAYLDSFATSNLFNSNFTISINWNTWENVGMATTIERPSDLNYFHRKNYISPHQGKNLFLKAISNNYTNIVVSNYAINKYQQKLLEINAQTPIEQINISRNELNVATNYEKPRNLNENILAKLWQENLGIDIIGINDDYFTLGGHSLKALKLVENINKALNCNISIQNIYENPTIAHLTLIVGSENNQKTRLAVQLKKTSQKSPIVFLIHPITGMIYSYNFLLQEWDFPTQVYGFQDSTASSENLDYKNLSLMATKYLEEIKKIQPCGPYSLIGYSLGGAIAHEIAHLLQKNDEEIKLLCLIDSWCVFSENQKHEAYFKESLKIEHKDLPTNIIELAWKRMCLLISHTPSIIDQKIILFKATELLDDYKNIDDNYNGWSIFNKKKIICYSIPGNHETILNKKNSHIILKHLRKYL